MRNGLYCFMSKKVESGFEPELLPDLEGYVCIRQSSGSGDMHPTQKSYGSGSAAPTIDNNLATGSKGSILMYYVSQIEMCGRPCFQSVFGLSLQKSVIGVGILGKYKAIHFYLHFLLNNT
jgi:hypothetical protein